MPQSIITGLVALVLVDGRAGRMIKMGKSVCTGNEEKIRW